MEGKETRRKAAQLIKRLFDREEALLRLEYYKAGLPFGFTEKGMEIWLSYGTDTRRN